MADPSGRGRFAGLSQSWYAWRFPIVIVCLAAMTLAAWLSGSPRLLGRTVTVSETRPELGNGFIARLSRPDLSADKTPVDALLFEIRTVRGPAAFEELDKRFGWSLAYLNLRGRLLARMPDFSLERREILGPGNELHQEIRDRGRGRYSVWKGYLYFSTSDNSSPMTNGRRYELWLPMASAATLVSIAWLLRTLAAVVLVLTLLRVLGEGRFLRTLVANTLPGVFVTFVILILATGGFELYQRWVRHAFADIAWPTRFDPVAGYVFQPGAELRWTNHVDFWTRTRVNSLGFLDAEPALPKPPGRFRVLLVGDSFVEAAQVTIDEKVQTLLRGSLASRLGPDRADVVAFGHSGTGQANQLGFYERYGREVAPDLVILLAVANDFANNSPVLESVRNGWHPYVPPRPFYERDGASFRRIDPSPDWVKHRLGEGDPAANYAALMQIPEFAAKLAGWLGPVEEDTDAVFWRPALPLLFDDATVLTGHALEVWKALGALDGFKVVVVAAENMTRRGAEPLAERERYARRFQAVAEGAGLPFLDLYPYFAKQPDPKAATWSSDSHWNQTGHQWAAAAIYDFLVNGGFLPSR